MLGGGETLDIKVMHSQGLSIREIARRTGHGRKTVRKYLRSTEVPKYKPRPPRPSKLDPYKDYLKARMADGVFNANRLFAKIRALGYTRGKTILKEFLKPLRPLQKPNATMRFETKPGEQAQVDFGVFQYEEEGHRRQVYAFVMVMSYSRAMYVEFVERQDVSTLIKCHIHALEYFGGVPGENGCHIEVYAAGVRVALHPKSCHTWHRGSSSRTVGRSASRFGGWRQAGAGRPGEER